MAWTIKIKDTKFYENISKTMNKKWFGPGGVIVELGYSERSRCMGLWEKGPLNSVLARGMKPIIGWWGVTMDGPMYMKPRKKQGLAFNMWIKQITHVANEIQFEFELKWRKTCAGEKHLRKSLRWKPLLAVVPKIALVAVATKNENWTQHLLRLIMLSLNLVPISPNSTPRTLTTLMNSRTLNI